MAFTTLRLVRSWTCPGEGDRFVWIAEVPDADLANALPGWSPPPESPRLPTASDDGVARWRLLLDLRVVGITRRAAGGGR
jgi:hypothetical protein